MKMRPESQKRLLGVALRRRRVPRGRTLVFKQKRTGVDLRTPVCKRTEGMAPERQREKKRVKEGASLVSAGEKGNQENGEK